MNIYGIGGLGTDERVFSKIELSDKIISIHWIKHHKNDNLTSYAQRLATQINNNEPFVLIGVSLGGFLAVELNKFVSPVKTILISSAEKYYEIPLFFRIAGKLKLLKIFPFLVNPPKFVIHWAFGAKNKKLLNAILDNTDPKFTNWALHSIMQWRQNVSLPNHIQIHGTRDRLLPFSKKKDAFKIEKGGHFMIEDRAKEISEIIQNEIDRV